MPPLDGAIIRSCFDITQLGEWAQDPQHKGVKDAIAKRIDVIMTMNIRAADPGGCTPQQAQELRWFEEQYRVRKRGACAEYLRQRGGEE